MPRSTAPAPRGRARAPILLIAGLAACARPAPIPEPTPPPVVVQRADTAAPADSIAVVPPPDTTLVAPAPDTAAAPRVVHVCAGGDVTIGTNLDTLWAVDESRELGRRVAALPDPDSLLSPLRPLVDSADVILLNVEGAIGEGPAPRKCRPGSRNCYAFRQQPEVAAALRRLGGERAAVVGNVANNHARDAGEVGKRATIEHLRSAGVAVTGADTLASVVVTPRGDTVAILGFSTDGGAPDPRDLPAVRRHVARAAAEHDRVIVTMHMGAEGASAQRTPDATEMFLGSVNRGNSVAFARTAVSAGADLVVGHGPHVMRAAEWWTAPADSAPALIIYSLGNLLTYGPFSMREPMRRGAIACALMAPDGRVQEAAILSTRQQPPGIVSVDPEARAAALVDSLGRLDFPDTGARVRANGAVSRP